MAEVEEVTEAQAAEIEKGMKKGEEEDSDEEPPELEEVGDAGTGASSM